jgi:very-short-patch-repair endonuclease
MGNKYIHNNNKLLERRRKLRNQCTRQEKILWYYLKNKKLGCKFQRQHSIGHYIADFYCPSKNLIIELDGNQHLENQKYDHERTGYLEMRGFKVLRFWNNEIDANLIEVLATIQECLTT